MGTAVSETGVVAYLNGWHSNLLSVAERYCLAECLYTVEDSSFSRTYNSYAIVVCCQSVAFGVLACLAGCQCNGICCSLVCDSKFKTGLLLNVFGKEFCIALHLFVA